MATASMPVRAGAGWMVALISCPRAMCFCTASVMPPASGRPITSTTMSSRPYTWPSTPTASARTLVFPGASAVRQGMFSFTVTTPASSVVHTNTSLSPAPPPPDTASVRTVPTNMVSCSISGRIFTGSNTCRRSALLRTGAPASKPLTVRWKKASPGVSHFRLSSAASEVMFKPTVESRVSCNSTLICMSWYCSGEMTKPSSERTSTTLCTTSSRRHSPLGSSTRTLAMVTTSTDTTASRRVI
mmetsp:Transcript_34702/g.66283  ORF Transcript_34702/g.66283 Transcript_34702/m.66283 type:complete len:243 (+) Transcript_34702:2331-3059(+)